MTDVPQESPAYQWAINTDPDILVLQFPPVPVVAGGAAQDAMKGLLAQRGFRPVVEAERLDLQASRGCLLTRLGPASAELLVTIGARVGASRIPLVDVDPAWLERAVDLGTSASWWSALRSASTVRRPRRPCVATSTPGEC